MKLEFRTVVPADWPAIVQLHIDQQAKQGTACELPNLFRHPVVAAIVGVDSQGIVRQCIYGEAVVELTFVGTDPRCTAQARRQIGGFSFLLQGLGYRWLETYVLAGIKKRVVKPLLLAGFECQDHRTSHFTKDLRRLNE